MHPWDRVRKHSNVMWFEDLKKPVVESKRKPPTPRKSLFEEIGEPSQEKLTTKLKKYQRLFALIFHNYKE